MSYKSPIEVITKEVMLQMEDDIVKAVQKYGINVNKTELQKALMYDRKQYTQGFEDGKKYAESEFVRHGHWIDDGERYGNGNDSAIWECDQCGETIWVYLKDHRRWNYCPQCGSKMSEKVLIKLKRAKMDGERREDGRNNRHR